MREIARGGVDEGDHRVGHLAHRGLDLAHLADQALEAGAGLARAFQELSCERSRTASACSAIAEMLSDHLCPPRRLHPSSSRSGAASSATASASAASRLAASVTALAESPTWRTSPPSVPIMSLKVRALRLISSQPRTGSCRRRSPPPSAIRPGPWLRPSSGRVTKRVMKKVDEQDQRDRHQRGEHRALVAEGEHRGVRLVERDAHRHRAERRALAAPGGRRCSPCRASRARPARESPRAGARHARRRGRPASCCGPRPGPGARRRRARSSARRPPNTRLTASPRITSRSCTTLELLDLVEEDVALRHGAGDHHPR